MKTIITCLMFFLLSGCTGSESKKEEVLTKEDLELEKKIEKDRRVRRIFINNIGMFVSDDLELVDYFFIKLKFFLEENNLEVCIKKNVKQSDKEEE